MKTKIIALHIHDQFLLGEIDNQLHKTPLKFNSLPSGKECIAWLEALFTLHLLKKHKDELHYIKTFVAKKTYPEVLDILRTAQDELNNHYTATKKETAKAEHFMLVLNGLKDDDKKIEINSLITPCTMLFIGIITACDNIIRQYRTQYLCGLKSKKQFYLQRKLVLKKFANIRRLIQEAKKKNNIMIQELK
ncbi:hypothetical protein LTF62_004603 [Salmonella enterica]|nr:hypothetical protein [Salmonella enterica]